MKNLLVRLVVLVSVGAIIYFVISNKTSKVKKEKITIIKEVEAIAEPESKIVSNNNITETEKTVNLFIDEGQIFTYSNDIDTFTLEKDYLDEIKIMHVVEHGLNESYSWYKKHYVFKNNNIYLTFAYTEYQVNSNMLIITKNDESVKYNLIDIK